MNWVQRLVALICRLARPQPLRPVTAPLPWRRIASWAAIGMIFTSSLVIGTLGPRGGLDQLVTPGRTGPAAATIHHDFPNLPMVKGDGGDGQIYYAIARQPMHLTTAARDLRWPRYWLQRPLFPALAWALHPSGGGHGLVLAVLVVGLAGLLLAGLAGGALSTTLGGPAWIAAVATMFPGAWLTLRASTPDLLALGLAFAAITFSLRGHARLALVVAVAAVLTRETSIVLIAGFALSRRDREGVALAAVPAVVLCGWVGLLRVVVPGGAYPPDITFPGHGLASAAALWFSGRNLFGFVAVAAAVGAGVIGLVRQGLKHPLAGIVLLELMMISVLAPMPMTMTSIARVVEPLLCVGLIMARCRRSAVAASDSSAALAA